MHVFRPTYHSPIYEPAKYSTKHGKRYARFRLPKSGMYVTGEVLPSGKAKVEQSLYSAYIRKPYIDDEGMQKVKTVRVQLRVADKDAAISKAAQMQLDADRGDDGSDRKKEQAKKLAVHRGTRLLEHLEDYRVSLETNNGNKEYVAEVYALIYRICSFCQFWKTDDFDPKSLNRYLTGIIAKGNSYRTRNKALVVMGGFVNWLRSTDRYDGGDPWRTIKKLPEQADPNKRERRALTAEEAIQLIAAAKAGKTIRSVTGEERSVLYTIALVSGLRAAELGKLQVRDLAIGGEFPYIDLPPAIAKTKREALQPLPHFAADLLAKWIKAKRPTDRVFNLYSEAGHIRETALMMKNDLAAAGVSRDEGGILDFHSLRTTFVTNTCHLTDQFTAAKLSRHSRVGTLTKHYDKQLIAARHSVVQQLPSPSKA